MPPRPRGVGGQLPSELALGVDTVLLLGAGEEAWGVDRGEVMEVWEEGVVGAAGWWWAEVRWGQRASWAANWGGRAWGWGAGLAGRC